MRNQTLLFAAICVAFIAVFTVINLYNITSTNSIPSSKEPDNLPTETTDPSKNGQGKNAEEEITRLKNELKTLSKNYRNLEKKFINVVQQKGQPIDNDNDESDDDDDDTTTNDQQADTTTLTNDQQATNKEDETTTTTTSSDGMNIVLLYADDWTYKTLGAMGNTFVKTPHLDALASEGVLFTHNCVTTSICWISRATLYTGQHVSRHKSAKIEDSDVLYENWNDSLYGMLAKNGYYNGFFGKWHHAMDRFPGWSFAKTEFYYGHHWLDDEKKNHVTQKNMRDGVNFLRERPRDKPFSLTVSFFATHAEDGNPEQYLPQPESMELYKDDVVPIAPNADVGNASTKFWDLNPPFFNDVNEGRTRWKWRYDTHEKYQKMMKNYYRMATEVDKACGSIIHELKQQNILNNTMIIFTTDNGNYHAEHGLADKWYPHEESIRVPLVVYDPRLPDSKKGIKNDKFTLNIDLAPTILKAAGLEPPKSMQGEDFAELYLEDDKKWRKEFYYEWPDPFEQAHFIPAVQALIRKDYKYIYWPQHNYHQLYDMVKDPLELNDLHNDSSLSAIFSEMKSKFAVLQADAAGNVTTPVGVTEKLRKRK